MVLALVSVALAPRSGSGLVPQHTPGPLPSHSVLCGGICLEQLWLAPLLHSPLLRWCCLLSLHTPLEQEAAMVPCEAAVQGRATPCPSPRLGLLPADTAAACTQQHPSGVPLCFMQQGHCAAISV